MLHYLEYCYPTTLAQLEYIVINPSEGKTFNAVYVLIQALLGSARCFQLNGTPALALERINTVIAQQPWFLAALIEKAGLLISMHDWEEAMELVMQVLQTEPDNIDALHLSGVVDIFCFLKCYASAAN